jgi:hypothetical protein
MGRPDAGRPVGGYFTTSLEDVGLRQEADVVQIARTAVGALVVALLLHAAPVRATLGEQEPSVEADRGAMGMSGGPVAARGGQRVHELTSSTVSVREFVTPSGIVFAIAWSGLTRPDLAQLLGSYYGEYRRAATREPGGRRPRHVETAQVVVETWGHARALRGRAWLPALTPAGVNLDDVQ